MITNPIIPIWLMTILSMVAIIFVIYNKQIKDIISNKKEGKITDRQKKLVIRYIINSCIKVCIIILLFIINLRFMVLNGDSIAINSDYSVLFVIDKSVSMRALDYNGNNERVQGVIDDCCYIVDELASSKFSIIKL